MLAMLCVATCHLTVPLRMVDSVSSAVLSIPATRVVHHGSSALPSGNPQFSVFIILLLLFVVLFFRFHIVESCGISLSLSDLFHLASHPPGRPCCRERQDLIPFDG